MRFPNRQLLVGSLGFLMACAGMVLRLGARAFSMQTSTPAKVIGPGGKSLGGSISFSFENTARTAALTDIGMVLLYAGAALLVIAVTVWMLAPSGSGTPFNPIPTEEKESCIAIPERIRFALRWPFGKKEP